MKIKYFLVAAVLLTAVFCLAGFAVAQSVTSVSMADCIAAPTVSCLTEIINQLSAQIAQIQSSSASPSPSSTWCHTFTTYSLIGATDATTNGEVSALQTALTDSGYNVSSDTPGIFGQATFLALESFQQKYLPANVTPTGTTGPLTRAALNSLYKCPATSGQPPKSSTTPVSSIASSATDACAWQCTNWSSCSYYGQQTRTCADYHNVNNILTGCGGTTPNEPATEQSCHYSCQSNWQCNSWSSCNSNNQQTRVCNYIEPVLNGNSDLGCVLQTDEPATTQTCVLTPNPCNPNWSCADWSDCNGGNETRTCTDLNRCAQIYPSQASLINQGEPALTQVCNPKITLNYQATPNTNYYGFYYNTAYNFSFDTSDLAAGDNILLMVNCYPKDYPYYPYNNIAGTMSMKEFDNNQWTTQDCNPIYSKVVGSSDSVNLVFENGATQFATPNPANQNYNQPVQVIAEVQNAQSQLVATDSVWIQVYPDVYQSPTSAVNPSIISPVGGENMTAGGTFQIKWMPGQNIPYQNMWLYKGGEPMSYYTGPGSEDSAITFIGVPDTTPRNSDGSITTNWAIPADLPTGSNYSIVITDNTDKNILAQMAEPFTITAENTSQLAVTGGYNQLSVAGQPNVYGVNYTVTGQGTVPVTTQVTSITCPASMTANQGYFGSSGTAYVSNENKWGTNNVCNFGVPFGNQAITMWPAEQYELKFNNTTSATQNATVNLKSCIWSNPTNICATSSFVIPVPPNSSASASPQSTAVTPAAQQCVAQGQSYCTSSTVYQSQTQSCCAGLNYISQNSGIIFGTSCGVCESASCTQNCTGKQCGASDGCGGVCQTCPTGQTCNGTACVAVTK